MYVHVHVVFINMSGLMMFVANSRGYKDDIQLEQPMADIVQVERASTSDVTTYWRPSACCVYLFLLLHYMYFIYS